MSTPPSPRPLLGGFAPLVVGLVLALLMVLLVPSVAPERVVTRPDTTGVTVEGAAP